jgi:hypothetical protein
MFSLLWGLVVLLFVFWVLSFSLYIAGSLIHILLVIAIAGAVYNFAVSRNARQ